jgi:hypothetical protein
MHVRLWPTGVKFIDIGSRHEFLAKKAMLIDALSMAGEKSGSQSKRNDVLNFPASAHSLITTKGQHGQTTWNLKFAKRMVPSVDLLWVSSPRAPSEWRDALVSPVMRKLVEASSKNANTLSLPLTHSARDTSWLKKSGGRDAA